MPQFDFSASLPYPVGAGFLGSSSGNVAAASAVATLTPSATRTAFLTGFVYGGLGATAASVVTITVSGLLGGSLTYQINVPAGATVSIPATIINFPFPLPASAVNTAIVVTMPTLGAGNTNAFVTATGYQI